MKLRRDRRCLLRSAALAATAAALLGATGCSSPRASVQTEPVPGVSAPAGQEATRLARKVAEEILSHPFPAEGEVSPLLVMQGFRNRSAHALQTADLADQLRATLAASGKVRFVDPRLCAQWLAGEGLHASASEEDTGIKMARRLGASYVVRGWVSGLRASEISAGPPSPGFSRITVEIADAETGLVILRKSAP